MEFDEVKALKLEFTKCYNELMRQREILDRQSNRITDLSDKVAKLEKRLKKLGKK